MSGDMPNVADNLAGARAMIARAQQQTVNQKWKGWWAINAHLKVVDEGVQAMNEKMRRLEKLMRIKDAQIKQLRKRTLVSVCLFN